MADDLTALSLFNIRGWVTIVTGGGTGLGLMAAQTLAANGAKVYITGRRVEKLREAETQHPSGGSITGIAMDVTSKDSIVSVAKEISEKESHINLLVNNAGITSVNFGSAGQPQGTPEEISARMLAYQSFKDWDDVYRVNVASIYFASAAFLPLMCAARDKSGFAEAGSIINVSSISGLTKDSQHGQFSYNASKAATISLTEQLAVDFKRPGVEVRVNTIAPGYFPSEMTPVGVHKEKEKEYFRKDWGIPFGRAGVPRDYAQALLNFAVNQYCSGSTLVIDGGYLLDHP